MTRILLCGAGGRMGRAVAALAAESPDRFTVSAGIDIRSCEAGFPVYGDISEFSGEADVIIDFSSPSMLTAMLGYAVSHRIPAVIAVTGIDAEGLEAIKKAAETIPVFRSRNMSIGINLLMKLVSEAAALLCADGTFDPEIVESHHRNKLDAPSGTAEMLAEAVSEAMGGAEFVYNRHDRREIRPSREIGIHSLRGGTVVGEHEVIFEGPDEVITLSHSAASRDVFALGALRAAEYIAGEGLAPGIYGMNDMIDSGVNGGH